MGHELKILHGNLVFQFLNSIVFFPEIIKSANGCETERHFKAIIQ